MSERPTRPHWRELFRVAAALCALFVVASLDFPAQRPQLAYSIPRQLRIM